MIVLFLISEEAEAERQTERWSSVNSHTGCVCKVTRRQREREAFIQPESFRDLLAYRLCTLTLCVNLSCGEGR